MQDEGDALVEITINGKTLKGYVLEPTEGEAIGTISLTNKVTMRAVQTCHLARSDKDLKAHQTEEAYSAAAARLHINSVSLCEA